MRDSERDAEWVTGIKHRDEAALEAVVRHYTGYVLTVIRKVSVPPLSEEDAEELASDVFVTLWKKAHSLRNPLALKSWLSQVARRVAVDRLRQRHEQLPLDDEVLILDNHQPDNVAVLREQTQIVTATLETMEKTRRVCMIYRYFYGEELTTIAKRLNLPLSTVKSHVYRGRQMLIAALKEWGYCDEENNNDASVV